jgi:drug/metabolite transporter (DMT)-like permease
MRVKADLTLFFVAIIWGASFISQDIAARYQLAYLFNGVSFILGALILLPFIPRQNKLSRGQWIWMLVAGTVLFAASALQQIGILYTKVANAGFLTSLYVVFTPFILWLLFRERPHHLDLLAVFIASLGAFLLSTGGRFEVQPGDGLELIGAIFWAIHFVILGKFAFRYEPVSFAAGQFFVGGTMNLIIGLFFEDPASTLAIPVLGATLYRAIFSIAIGYTLQVWGQRHTPPTDAALILGLESIFAGAAGWLFLRQTMLPIQLAGCAIIFFAVMIAQFKSLQQSRIEPA